jgi:hypothetical protein
MGETFLHYAYKYSRLALVPTHSPFNVVLPLEVKGRTSCWPIASIYCQGYECVEHYYPDSPYVFVVLNHRNNFIVELSSKICQEFHHAADALPISLPTLARGLYNKGIVVPFSTGERVQRYYLHEQSPCDANRS